ncbi:hypothetical protein CU044_4927 [Streptomyces sp. L-9-10]|uniref:hypothetical protein n=1 Tax=unclassified Streptomyces TaxID=2593676 RepID=UPI00101C0451|nr:hypothetical protein [Streptomyces sp. L-9-10]RYJ25016.1 hypothetical protein CU044_4927 [Streptomyces sp. L-9-10]
MSFGQGGPSWGGPGSPDHDPHGTQTPDWAALADASAARTRRKRWLMIGGGVLATGAIAAIVATAVVSMNGGNDRGTQNTANELPTPTDLPDRSPEAEPTFSSVEPLPPPNPKDYVSSADKDKAPLSAGTLFPGDKVTMSDRAYAKGATARTTNCAAAAQGALGSILASNSCDQVIRATYSKGGVAVTVGVAVFETEALALKAKDQAKGGIASLSGAGVPTFCRAPSVCRKTTNSYGRYVYFTVGGFTSGKNVTTSDKDVFTTGDDIAEFAFRQILARGRAQASAAATAPVAP